MEHEPGRFLSDTQRPVKLPTADAVLAVGFKPERRKPLAKAQRAFLHDGPRLDAESLSVMVFPAFPNAARLDVADPARSATRAANSRWPAQGSHEHMGGFLFGKDLDRLNKSGRSLEGGDKRFDLFRVHANILAEVWECVKYIVALI